MPGHLCGFELGFKSSGSDNGIWLNQLGEDTRGEEISGGLRKSRILKPLGTSKSLASGSPNVNPASRRNGTLFMMRAPRYKKIMPDFIRFSLRVKGWIF